MAPIYNTLPKSAEADPETESQIMVSEDESRYFSDDGEGVLRAEVDADAAVEPSIKDIETGNSSHVDAKTTMNCVVSNLKSLELGDRDAERTKKVKLNSVKNEGPEREESNLNDTVDNNVQNDNSGNVRKENKYTGKSEPSNENQAISAQKGKRRQRQRQQKNSKSCPADRNAQPPTGNARINSRPRDGENDGASASGVQPVQKSVVTFGSQSHFYNKATDEFIRKEKPTLKKIKQLNFSARFVQAGMEIVLNNNGCLLMVDEDFLAEVKIERPNLLNEAINLWQAKEILFEQIQIVAVLVDKRATILTQHREEILTKFTAALKHSSKDRRLGMACIQMMRLVGKFFYTKKLFYSRFFQEIENNKILSDQLREHIKVAQEVEKTVFKRSQFFAQFGYRLEDDSRLLYQKIQRLLTEICEHHKSTLMEITPEHLHKQFDKVSRERIMLITENDMKRFSNMRSVLNEDMFSKPLQDLEQLWLRQMEQIKTNCSNNEIEVTNDMFVFLCKSLQELILEISELTGLKPASLLRSTPSGWHPINQINWKEDNLLTKCLEHQYFFMFRLLKHFAMVPTYGKKPFQYEAQFFNKFEKNATLLGGIESMISRTKRLLDIQPNHLDLPDEIYVWYCLVDDVLHHVLPKNCDLSDTERTLQSYLKLIHEAKVDHLESLRVATHNTIRFIVQVVPYISSAPDTSTIDRCILQKQMAITSSEEPSSSSMYRDLVNVFSSYWKFRKDVVSEIVSKMPLPEMTLLKEQLLRIVSAALEKNVDKDRVVTFFRTYEEFLINLNEVPFDWFIKGLTGVDMLGIIFLRKIKAVDNKLKDTVNATYRVIDPRNFTTFCRSFGDQTEVPKHYVIETLKMLLAFVESLLKKESWTSGEYLTEEDKLSTACDLLSALHQSLLFMKELPEYVSFELFYEESIKPFASLINTSSSRQDFSTRVQLLKQSYWFFRKQNDINVDKALDLYKSLNSSIDTQLLKRLYQRYLDHYEKYMQMFFGQDSYTKSLLIPSSVMTIIPKNKLFTTWDSNFKQNKVPQILAGLAAVWSMLVSKDVSSTGKFLSPHCIQILCVLHLLSSDKPRHGIDKHLAQVLTGQGKSLILALVAALLALTGHKVDIGCYSKYLVARDRDDFNTFYSLFDVTSKVSYGTLGKLMGKFIHPKAKGQTKGLRDIVNDHLHNDGRKEQSILLPVDFSKSVLLIDEVDVFFTDQFYGNTYNPCVTPVIKGIDNVQEYIWKIVCQGHSFVEDIVRHVWRFISISNLQDLTTFINRNKTYELLTDDCVRKSYNNRKLFDEHLRVMIECAIEVSKNTSFCSKFKLNASGIITYNKNGEYVTPSESIRSYYNIFNYFRLKKVNFVPQINGHDNYGYLNVGCGALSYALLPMNYSLIIGVSGTLTSLNAYEKLSINQMYGIKNTSVVPSFFGGSNLCFNEYADFQLKTSVSSWKQYIFSRANQMLVKNRAVLIFFETDIEIDEFKASYGGQFDRLNVLTENTDDKEKFIDEAGIAKTVTLATRGMGRGVDYKSSVMVEKNGGVHVIQTFFSMDIKEETQIKGRTARQDNKGSYEIVLCRKKMDESISLLSDVPYKTISRQRQELAIEAHKKTSEAIEENKKQHNATLKYMKSYFRGW